MRRVMCILFAPFNPHFLPFDPATRVLSTKSFNLWVWVWVCVCCAGRGCGFAATILWKLHSEVFQGVFFCFDRVCSYSDLMTCPLTHIHIHHQQHRKLKVSQIVNIIHSLTHWCSHYSHTDSQQSLMSSILRQG